MGEIANIHLRRLHGQLGELVYELAQFRLSSFSQPSTWSPAINAYLCRQQIAICVDLAGVDRPALEVKVQAGRLHIRGRREPPEPAGPDQKPLQVLALEIDYGPFEREIVLPSEVEADRVTAEQRNGLLWVYLPLRCAA